MATIPQSIDYGARPSLRSGRVDVPGGGENALADAISVAAAKFANVMEQSGSLTYRFTGAQFRCDYAGQIGDFNAMCHDILSIAGAVLKATEKFNKLGV